MKKKERIMIIIVEKKMKEKMKHCTH